MLVRKLFTIAGPVYYADSFPPTGDPDKTLQYFTDTNHTSAPITLTVEGIPFKVVFKGAKTIIAEGTFPDDAVFLKYLTDKTVAKDPALEERIKLIDEAADRVLEIVKYIFDFPPLKEYLKFAKATAEVFEGGTWITSVDRAEYSWVGSNAMFSLDKGTVATLQSLLKDGVEPLHAMKFLSKAKAEENLRDKCLLLATAAEQAIKEYFVRVGHPKKQWFKGKNIEDLYDTELTVVSGNPSPHLAGILENAGIRNKIVHRPGHDPEISGPDSIRLTDEVEKGILHLMKLLYSGNKILESLYNKVDNSWGKAKVK